MLPSSLTADDLNNFFIDKILKIREGISAGPLPEIVENPANLPSFTFEYPTPGKIAKIISSLRNTGALGIDGISVAALKKGAPVLANPIAHLVQTSLSTARIPAGFKVAVVSPVFKGKNKSPLAPASYRPVAILPALSKVLERVVVDSLSKHLENLLPNSQFGFRASRNTASAVAYAHSSWTRAKMEGKSVAIAAYDMSSAFDTIDVGILTKKLIKLGVRGKQNDWFANYLTGRHQCVSAHSNRSSLLSVSHGVPQGSILGPLLFLVMMAELPEVIGIPPNMGGIVGYADDIALWVTEKDTMSVKNRIELASDRILEYAASHFLAVNASKTQVMWLTKEDHPVRVGTSVVDGSKTLELLGVSFDKNLRSTPFMRSQEKASRTILGVTRRLCRHLPPALTSQVSATLYAGKLGYAAAAAVTPRLSDSDPSCAALSALQTPVNDAARSILGIKRSDKCSITELLKKSGLPSINRLVIKGAALETWKALKVFNGPHGTPGPFGSLILENQERVRATRATEAGLLRPPNCGNCLLKFSILLWNSSPELRAAESLTAATGWPPN